MMNNKNANLVETIPSAKATGARGLACGLALAAMVAVPGLAMAAGGASDSQSYQLSYNAAELKSMGSAKALHRRIRRVALAHCPDYGTTKDLRDRAACIKEVETDLVSKVNHPLLTQIHSGDSAMSIAAADR